MNNSAEPKAPEGDLWADPSLWNHSNRINHQPETVTDSTTVDLTVVNPLNNPWKRGSS